jgi:hypothetical protein
MSRARYVASEQTLPMTVDRTAGTSPSAPDARCIDNKNGTHKPESDPE